MSKLTLKTPIELDINIEEHLSHASLKALTREIERRSRDTVAVETSDFISLTEAIVAMRFNDAFALLEKASPYLVRAQELKQRQLDYILHRAEDHALEQITPAPCGSNRINEITKDMRSA